MKITVLHSAIGGFAFSVEPNSSPLVLGRRGAELDLELPWDPRISRCHARVWVEGSSVWYEDLGSRNGSWIGNEKITGRVRLGTGESVLLGETALVVASNEPLCEAQSIEETHESFPPDLHDLLMEEASSIITNSLGVLVPTDDLRIRSRPPTSRRRLHKRVDDDQQVIISLSGREELGELWLRDISKGGLFLETDDPPQPGTKLSVRITTPNGDLELNATVVHVLSVRRAKEYGTSPGAGLAFTDLDDERRSAIRAYVEGVHERLNQALKPTQLADEAAEKAMNDTLATTRRILKQSDDDSLYAALDLSSVATHDQILRRLRGLTAELEELTVTLPPPQAARVRAARTVLGRIQRVLGSEASRLEYDFRYGHVRAQERIACARDGSGPSLAVLRRAWNRVAPDRVDQAALLTRQAFAARQVQDLAGAIEHGRRALELNPFFEELRETVATWERLNDSGNGNGIRQTG